MKTSRKLLSVSIVAASLGSTVPAQSQMLEEVIVTAQKRQESLQDTPIAISAVTSEALIASGINSQIDLPKIVPNLSFNVVTTFASPYLRGVGTSFALPGLENSVPVYFDDAYLPRASSGLFSFGDIERIEVVKGPQGTLYGRNATGGAIRVITKAPKNEFEASASVLSGTNDRLAFEGMVNVPVGDSGGLRLNYRHDENDGYIRNISPGATQGRLADRNEDLLTARLLLNPTERLTVNVSADYSWKDDSEGRGFRNLFPGAPEQIGAAVGGCVAQGFFDVCSDLSNPANVFSDDVIGTHENSGMSFRLDYDANIGTFSSITTYRRAEEVKNNGDLDATGALFQHGAANGDTQQVTQEFQLTSGGSGPLSYIAGLYYLNETAEYAYYISGMSIDGLIGFPGAAFGAESEVQTQSFAPYFQLDYDLSDDWTLTLGARYTWEEKTLERNDIYAGTLGANGFVDMVLSETPVTAPDLSFERFTPKVTLSYQASDELMMYVTYANGFKSGGFSTPAFGAVDSVDEELLNDIEGGIKYETDRLRLNLAAYYYIYEDLQVQLVDSQTGASRVQNSGEANLTGIEFDLTWVPMADFELGAGAAYSHARFDKFEGDVFFPCSSLPTNAPDISVGACAAQGGLGLTAVPGLNLENNSLPNAPDFSGYVRANYRADLGRTMGSMTFSGILSYRSEAYFDAGNRFEDESREDLSVRVEWRSPDENYWVAAFGTNLTDTERYMSITPQGTGGFTVARPPRQLFIQAGVNF